MGPRSAYELPWPISIQTDMFRLCPFQQTLHVVPCLLPTLDVVLQLHGEASQTAQDAAALGLGSRDVSHQHSQICYRDVDLVCSVQHRLVIRERILRQSCAHSRRFWLRRQRRSQIGQVLLHDVEFVLQLITDLRRAGSLRTSSTRTSAGSLRRARCVMTAGVPGATSVATVAASGATAAASSATAAAIAIVTPPHRLRLRWGTSTTDRRPPHRNTHGWPMPGL